MANRFKELLSKFFPGKNEEDEEKFKNVIQTNTDKKKSELSKIDEELKKLGLK